MSDEPSEPEGDGPWRDFKPKHLSAEEEQEVRDKEASDWERDERRRLAEADESERQPEGYAWPKELIEVRAHPSHSALGKTEFVQRHARRPHLTSEDVVPRDTRASSVETYARWALRTGRENPTTFAERMRRARLRRRAAPAVEEEV